MKMDHPVNNYEKWCQEWQRRFLTLDQNDLLQKLPILTPDGEYLTFSYLHQKHGVHRITGELVCFDHDEPLTTFAKLNIYNLFWYCKDNVRLTGQWMPFKNLRDASPFGPAFQKTVLDIYSATFFGHTQELHTAFEKIGAKKLSTSDVGYEIRTFDCIPVRFLFWDGDDEFPAQSNILYDTSAVDFIHVENLVSIADEAILLLSRLADVPLAGKTFT